MFPFNYLGVLNVHGRMKAVYFEPLLDKIRARISGWKARILSFGGRITLIKSVLNSIPIYTLASMMVPKGVLVRIERLMASFLWNAQGERMAHWVNWNSICSPNEEGGLGLESLEDIRNSLHAKLLWLVLENNSLWARYAKPKYFQGDYPTSKGSPLWMSIVSRYQKIRDNSRWIIG